MLIYFSLSIPKITHFAHGSQGSQRIPKDPMEEWKWVSGGGGSSAIHTVYGVRPVESQTTPPSQQDELTRTSPWFSLHLTCHCQLSNREGTSPESHLLCLVLMSSCLNSCYHLKVQYTPIPVPITDQNYFMVDRSPGPQCHQTYIVPVRLLLLIGLYH